MLIVQVCPVVSLKQNNCKHLNVVSNPQNTPDAFNQNNYDYQDGSVQMKTTNQPKKTPKTKQILWSRHILLRENVQFCII